MKSLIISILLAGPVYADIQCRGGNDVEKTALEVSSKTTGDIVFIREVCSGPNCDVSGTMIGSKRDLCGMSLEGYECFNATWDDSNGESGESRFCDNGTDIIYFDVNLKNAKAVCSNGRFDLQFNSCSGSLFDDRK